MKKVFILSVIISIIMLFTVNGQSLVNQQSRFTKRINNNEKVELKEPELKPLESIKTNNINLKLKHNFRDIYTQRLDSIVYLNYDNVLMQLVNEELDEYTYDANNNMTSEIYSLWDTGINAWIFDDKYEYTYDANNNLTSYIYSLWDTGINDWIFYSKVEYTYDANNNMTSYIYSEWDTGINAWIFSSKREYTYDANNNLTSYIYSWWDTGINDWIFDDKYEYTYDANNNMTSAIYSEWDTGINDWIFNYKYEYTFNLAVNVSEIIAPEWYNNYLYPPFYNELLTEIYYSWDGTDFTINSKGTFYYSDIVGINEVIDNSIFIIYPNPANDYIMINAGSTNTNEIQIFNVYGQCVMSVDTQNNISEYRVDISNLPAGMYFTRIANDKNNVVKRFVKQ